MLNWEMRNVPFWPLCDTLLKKTTLHIHTSSGFHQYSKPWEFILAFLCCSHFVHITNWHFLTETTGWHLICRCIITVIHTCEAQQQHCTFVGIASVHHYQKCKSHFCFVAGYSNIIGDNRWMWSEMKKQMPHFNIFRELQMKFGAHTGDQQVCIN